jgi:hypothetical protein
VQAEAFLAAASPPHLADPSSEDADALKRQAADSGFAVFELDGALMKTKPALMDHLAKALSFPGDFGRNWDAAVDYLGDLSEFHGGTRFLIVIKDPAAIENADPKLYADFREVCGFACENARQWSRGTIRLKFVFTRP